MKILHCIAVLLVLLILILPHTFAYSIPSSGIVLSSDILETNSIDFSYPVPLILAPSDISPTLFQFSPVPFYVGYRDSSGVISNVTSTRTVPSIDQFVRLQISNQDTVFRVPYTQPAGIYLPTSNVNDGEYLYLMSANNLSSPVPDVSVDYIVSSPSRNVSTLTITLHSYSAFGFNASNSVTQSYGNFYNWYFSSVYLYYLDRDGTEVPLGTYLVNSSDGWFFYYPNLTFELNQYVSEIHYRYSVPIRISQNPYRYQPGLTNGSWHLFYHSSSEDSIDPGYAPPDEDIPLQMWYQIVEILKYLQNPMQVTLESILQAIKDGGSATGAVTVIVQQINNTVTNIANTVNNVLSALTPDPSQGDDANAFESAVGGLSDAVESDASALESLSPRPSPSDVITTISPDFLSPSDPDVKRGISVFSDVMSSPLIMPVFIVVFTLATVRFILFGKRG